MSLPSSTTSATSLTPEQHAAFDADGFLHLRAAFPPAAALELQDRMWEELREVHGIERNDRSTWYQPRKCLHGAKWDLGQGVIGAPRLIGAVHDLLGSRDWPLPAHWGVVLVTFPNPARAWTVPTAWHSDYELHGSNARLSDLFIFTFFSAVGPRGGGTLVVSGSHRLLQRFHDELSPSERQLPHRDLRKRFLRWDPWIRALAGVSRGPEDRNGYFMGRTHDVQGVPLRIVELMGEPGDAVLCHPLLLHVAAPNAAETPRFMRARHPVRSPQDG